MKIAGKFLRGKNDAKSNSHLLYINLVKLLSGKQKVQFLFTVFLVTSLGLLDVIAILLIGGVGTLALNLAASKPMPHWGIQLARVLHINAENPKLLLFTLCLFALLIFTAKTLFTVYLTKRLLVFLNSVQEKMALKMVKHLENASYGWLKTQNNQEMQFHFVEGIAFFANGVLLNIILLTSDFALLIMIFSLLFFVNKLTAVMSIIIFLSFLFAVNKILGTSVANAGKSYSEKSISARGWIEDFVSGFKEVRVFGVSSEFLDLFLSARKSLVIAAAKTSLIQTIPKVLVEMLLVGNITLLVGFLFLTESVNETFGIIFLFIAAATRLAPAILRIQSSFFEFRRVLSPVLVTLHFLESLILNSRDSVVPRDTEIVPIPINEKIAPYGVHIDAVSFSHLDSNNEAIADVSIQIGPGEIIGLAGPSGSGKTTLIDLLLGLYEPFDGKIKIDGIANSKYFGNVQSKIAYVPQSPHLPFNSLSQNIAFTTDNLSIDLGIVETIAQQSGLTEMLERIKLTDIIPEFDKAFSGGEKQRIAIARALYRKPLFLILDEATSSLDANSERLISDVVLGFRGKITTIVVAHRLTVLRHVDKIYYLDSGKILESGTFDELMKLNGQFAKQVQTLKNID